MADEKNSKHPLENSELVRDALRRSMAQVDAMSDAELDKAERDLRRRWKRPEDGNAPAGSGKGTDVPKVVFIALALLMVVGGLVLLAHSLLTKGDVAAPVVTPAPSMDVNRAPSQTMSSGNLCAVAFRGADGKEYRSGDVLPAGAMLTLTGRCGEAGFLHVALMNGEDSVAIPNLPVEPGETLVPLKSADEGAVQTFRVAGTTVQATWYLTGARFEESLPASAPTSGSSPVRWWANDVFPVK